MAKNAPNLAVAFNLPPERAVEYFRSRGTRIAGDWKTVATAVRSGSFSVAGVMKAQVLDDIRGALQDAIDTGQTYDDFKRGLVPKLQAAGWWGRWPADPETGEILPGKGIKPRRLETIFRTNVQGAYMAGRYKGMVEASDSHPFWMYSAIMDGRTRPAHQLLNGRVFRWDDPVWNVIYPPNGYNCRCRVRPLTQADMKRKGLALSKGGHLDTVTVDLGKRGGKIDVTGVRDPATGQRFAPDPGFDHNPSAAWSLDVELARRVATIRSPEIRAQTWQALNNSPARKSAYLDWISAEQAGTASKKEVQTIGFLPDDVATFYGEQREGGEAVRVVALQGGAFRYADRPDHHEGGFALSVEQWAMLPNIVAAPEDVYFDHKYQAITLTQKLEGGRRVMMSIVPGKHYEIAGHTRVSIDGITNAYLAPDSWFDPAKNRFTKMGRGVS